MSAFTSTIPSRHEYPGELVIFCSDGRFTQQKVEFKPLVS